MIQRVLSSILSITLGKILCVEYLNEHKIQKLFWKSKVDGKWSKPKSNIPSHKKIPRPD